jgi:hypothetical protein
MQPPGCQPVLHSTGHHAENRENSAEQRRHAHERMKLQQNGHEHRLHAHRRANANAQCGIEPEPVRFELGHSLNIVSIHGRRPRLTEPSRRAIQDGLRPKPHQRS